jgi:hypothetical protein
MVLAAAKKVAPVAKKAEKSAEQEKAE